LKTKSQIIASVVKSNISVMPAAKYLGFAGNVDVDFIFVNRVWMKICGD